jgi:hypothetical protein
VANSIDEEVPEESVSLRRTVVAELAELRERARDVTLKQLQAGDWFSDLLYQTLSSYAKNVDAGYFETKYPGLNRDAIVDRRIDLAQRYAALAGGISAAGYSAAVVATIGSKGGASLLTIPAALTFFAADLFLLSRQQLRLAYDLSLLYGCPIDLEDPEDLFMLLRVAFGVKAGETFQNALIKGAPEATRVGMKTVFSGATLHAAQALPVVGKHLLQRNMIKMAIPLVAVPLSSGLNYFMTGRIAATARQVFRDRAVIAELATNIASEGLNDSLLLLEVVWLMIRADGKTSEEEAMLLNALASLNSDSPEIKAEVERFRSAVQVDERRVLERLARASDETRRVVFDAACHAAAIDHRLHRKEIKQLERIAAASDLIFDASIVKALVAHYKV